MEMNEVIRQLCQHKSVRAYEKRLIEAGRKELRSLPPYVLVVPAVCFGYATRRQQERIKPARFGRRFLVQENSYHRMDAEELKQMRSARQQQEGRGNA